MSPSWSSAEVHLECAPIVVQASLVRISTRSHNWFTTLGHSRRSWTTLGLAQDLIVEAGDVVVTQDADVGLRPREVDRRFVASRLADLVRRAAGPDRFPDVANEIEDALDGPTRRCPGTQGLRCVDRRRRGCAGGPASCCCSDDLAWLPAPGVGISRPAES